MAVKNKKGIVSQNRKRMYKGKEVKPVMYSVRGKKKMVGSVDGELILDKLGQPIPFKQL
jgi:hypothetical protein